ncbi:MAG: hypothetical protein ACRER0_02805 [Gammaproteobacteria bacterium]
MIAKKSHVIGVILASLHLVGVCLTIWYIAVSTVGQASLVWAFWALIDFPWSLAYLLSGPAYAHWVEALSSAHPFLAQVMYFPHILHVLIGTIWWYFLPILVAKLMAMIRSASVRKKTRI